MAEQNGLGMRVQIALAAAVIAALAVPVLAQSGGGIAGVLPAGTVPELVKEGFVGTEGPVGTADGGLFFSDIRANKTYHLDPAGNFSVIRENTNGSNGLAFTKEGDLVFAEGDGKRISKRNKDGTIVTLTEGPPGAPLLAPNDLILDAKGGAFVVSQLQNSPVTIGIAAVHDSQ
jgi:gluconolactonase